MADTVVYDESPRAEVASLLAYYEQAGGLTHTSTHLVGAEGVGDDSAGIFGPGPGYATTKS